MDRRFDVVKVSNGRLEQKKNEENHCTSSTKGDFQKFGNSLERYIYIYFMGLYSYLNSTTLEENNKLYTLKTSSWTKT
jgi:hypothetical protein